MFAYLAGITERIGFASGVMVLPQRQTALVARQAADVDLLSHGRLRLGVGVGWNHVEYEALGYEFKGRGARQEEQIEVLRRLFRDPVVDFSGESHRIDRASLNPKPTRPIPIWLGGSSAVAFDRAARLADGFIFFGGDADHTVEAWNEMRSRLDALGRSVHNFGADWIALPDGDVETVATDVDAWRAAGGTHISLVTMGLGFDTTKKHIDYLDWVADAVLHPD
jgi:probable F420-dependent oxidoreductase